MKQLVVVVSDAEDGDAIDGARTIRTAPAAGDAQEAEWLARVHQYHGGAFLGQESRAFLEELQAFFGRPFGELVGQEGASGPAEWSKKIVELKISVSVA